MSSIEDAVRYPMEDDEWITTVLIGGGLLLLSFLVVPLFLVYGYVVRAIRATLEDDPEPPSFGDWGDLLVEGFQAVVIAFLYMLVPLIVLGITVGGAILAFATGGDAGVATGVGSLLLGGLLGFVLALAFGYLSVIALVNFAREERFGAAFDVGVIRNVAFDAEFAVPWLLSIAIFFVSGVVNVVPFVGNLLALFTGFYAAVVAANLWADGFSKAVGPGGSPDRTDADETIV